MTTINEFQRNFIGGVLLTFCAYENFSKPECQEVLTRFGIINKKEKECPYTSTSADHVTINSAMS